MLHQHVAIPRAPAWGDRRCCHVPICPRSASDGSARETMSRSVRRDRACVVSKVVIWVCTRNRVALCEARPCARGFQGGIVISVCTCVCRVPWQTSLVVLCTTPIVRVCHWRIRLAWDPMFLAMVRFRGACVLWRHFIQACVCRLKKPSLVWSRRCGNGHRQTTVLRWAFCVGGTLAAVNGRSHGVSRSGSCSFGCSVDCQSVV